MGDVVEKEEVKEFLKNKANWRFYNSIIDSLTRYEDINLEGEVNICVCYDMGDIRDSESLYRYVSGRKGDYVIFYNDMQELEEIYKRNGLLYSVSINNGVKNKTLKNKILKNKKVKLMGKDSFDNYYFRIEE